MSCTEMERQRVNLTRPEFLDRRLEPEELQNAALLWLHWFNLAHLGVMSGVTHTPKPGCLRLEVRLWGFPRHKGHEVREALRDALESAEASAASVALLDPDTIVAQSPCYSSTDQQEFPSFIPWLKLLLRDTFNGLWCELRLAAEDTGKRAAVRGNTLVFAGVLRGEQNGFRVRAIYPAGAGASEEYMFEHHGWDKQGAYLHALDNSSAITDVSDVSALPEWILSVFSPPFGNSVGRALLWLIAPRKSRLWDYTCRIFLMLSISVVCAYLAAALHESFPMLAWYGLTPIAVIAGFATVFLFWVIIHRVRMVHSLMSNSMERLYSNPIAHPERTLEQNPGFANDPALRKYSAELTRMGWSHFRDVGIEPLAAGDSYIRLYVLPEESALFAMMLMRGNEETTHYPARHGMILKTFFTDGSYLVSTNGHSGYRRAFPDSPAIPRVFSEVTDPEEMWERHQSCVARLQKQGKQRMTLHPEEIIPHLLDEHERNRAMLMKYGAFDWDAAFRMAFDIVRPEYRG